MSRDLIRLTLAVAGLAAVALAAAGCSAGAAATRLTAAHDRAGRAEAPFATRAESIRLGRKLLSEVVLPVGTRPFFGRKLPAELRQAPESSTANSFVDVHRVFAERRSMSGTVAFLENHNPAGWYNDGTGTGSLRMS